MNVPEMTRKRVLTTDKNGDFSRRVIDALFRLTTMDWTNVNMNPLVIGMEILKGVQLKVQ